MNNMSGCRELTPVEKLIICNLERTTNLTREEAKEIAFNCYQYGYVIHKYDFELLEIDRNQLRVKVDNLINELQKAKEENKKLKEQLDIINKQNKRNDMLDEIIKDFQSRPQYIFKMENENGK